MKIAHIIDNLSIGGAEKLILSLAQDFPGELVVISLRPQRLNNDLGQELANLGVKVARFPLGKLFNFSVIWKIYRFIKTEQADIIHTHLTYANIIGGMCSLCTGIPMVTTLHNVRGDVSGNRIRNMIVKFNLRYIAKAVIAVGEAVAQVYRPIIKSDKLRVIPNAINEFPNPSAEAVHRLRAELLGPYNHLLIAVGRLSTQKAYHDLIDTMALVHQMQSDIKLVIAGHGRLQDSMQEQIDALGLQDTVELLGLRKDVPVLLAASDLYVLSSHWEGLPVAVLEAMAASLPIVTTKVGELPYLMDDNGLLVEVGDIKGLANAILTLISDEDKRKQMGERSRQLVHEKYNKQTWLNQVMQVYAEVAGV